MSGNSDLVGSAGRIKNNYRTTISTYLIKTWCRVADRRAMIVVVGFITPEQYFVAMIGGCRATIVMDVTGIEVEHQPGRDRQLT